MKKVRAIIINPNDRTITERLIEPSLKEFYTIIGCETVEANYSGTILANTRHFLYIDEEGSFKKDKKYFHILGAHSPLTGIAVLLKYNGEGEEIDCTISVETLTPFVKFYTEQEVKFIYNIPNN